jgi:Flp pilus assembly protein TadD
MGQLLKFPVHASKLGYKRVRKSAQAADSPDQLHLFPPPTAHILPFAPALSAFEQALMLDERGDPTAAAFYAKAIAQQECVADAYCNLGILEAHTGDTPRAFDCFTRALEHNPRHSEAHYNLGNLYFDVNDFRLARLHYELAGQVDPSFANVYFNLALVQAISNDLAAAVGALTRYQGLVSEAEGRAVEELLHNLKTSLATASSSRRGSG